MIQKDISEYILEQKTEEKAKELKNLEVIRALGQETQEHLQHLCDQMRKLNEGFSAVSEVLFNWEKVFKYANVASNKVEPDPKEPTYLVRIPRKR